MIRNTLNKVKGTNKKGFTIIELMIVVAVIAILFIALLPKSGAVKNSAKDTGVITNVSTTIGFAENYVGKSQSWTTDGTVTKVKDALVANYSDLRNQVTKGGVDVYVINNATAVGSTLPTSVASATATDQALTTGTAAAATAGTPVNGSVVVEVHSDGLIVYGVDHAGAVLSAKIIK